VLALGLVTGKVILYDIERGMSEDESSRLHGITLPPGEQISSMMWSHVGRPHASWTLSDAEKEREVEWR
jgi:hypothetical protein